MTINNIGAIASLELPSGWEERSAQPQGLGSRWERRYAPRGFDEVELVFSYRGVPIDEASRKVFAYILSQAPREVSREEILALRTVMGVATVGDNQMTNPNQPGTLEGPAFVLDAASTLKVNNKSVLCVDGSFRNGAIFAGIFYPAGTAGMIVEEMFLQSRTEEEHRKYLPVFFNCIKSIAWQPSAMPLSSIR